MITHRSCLKGVGLAAAIAALLFFENAQPVLAQQQPAPPPPPAAAPADQQPAAVIKKEITFATSRRMISKCLRTTKSSRFRVFLPAPKRSRNRTASVII